MESGAAPGLYPRLSNPRLALAQVAPQPMQMEAGVPMGVPISFAEAPVPVAMGMAIPMEMATQAFQVGAQDQVPLLDLQTASILATINSFEVKQRVKFWEALTGGCCEQTNTYDFFDVATGTHVFVAQEQSEDLLRFCCAPYHSLSVKFKLVNSARMDEQGRAWMSKDEIYNLPTSFTLDREGCPNKPCLSCLICNDRCKDGYTMHAGEPFDLPKGTIGEATFAYASQPKCGGYFTPTVNVFSRTQPGGGPEAFAPLFKVEGPCIFGGCSELCCSSTFQVSAITKPDQIDQALKLGDVAIIKKTKPKGMCDCVREAFSDSDHFTVTFREGIGLTPQQKASMMGALILSDYMFFEKDGGMCSATRNGDVKITVFECYCCGMTQPCNLYIPARSLAGGAPPTSESMVR